MKQALEKHKIIRYIPDFVGVLKTYKMLLESEKEVSLQSPVVSILHPNIEKLLRYTVAQWSSINEQREPDHEDLVQHWLDGDCNDWIKNNIADN